MDKFIYLDHIYSEDKFCQSWMFTQYVLYLSSRLPPLILINLTAMARAA